MAKPMKVIAVSPESLWHHYRDLLEQMTIFHQTILKRYKNGDVKGFFVIEAMGKQHQIFISRVKLRRIK